MENLKFVHDILCFCVRGFRKCGYFILILNVSLFLKAKLLTYFQKFFFLIKVSEKLSAYSNSESLQIFDISEKLEYSVFIIEKSSFIVHHQFYSTLSGNERHRFGDAKPLESSETE